MGFLSKIIKRAENRMLREGENLLVGKLKGLWGAEKKIEVPGRIRQKRMERWGADLLAVRSRGMGVDGIIFAEVMGEISGDLREKLEKLGPG